MMTISPGNEWTVARQLFLKSPNDGSLSALEGAVVTVSVYSDAACTTLVGITPVELVMGYAGYYSKTFDQTEVDTALAALIGQDVYEVAQTSDGNYRDVATLRVTQNRLVPPGP